jgi:dienelactone hydrolase
MLGSRVIVLLLVLAACTSTGGPGGVPALLPAREDAAPGEGPLRYTPLDPDGARVEPAPRTVEDSFVLDLYTALHGRDYTVSRVGIPGSDGQEAVAHLLLPDGPGPHPAVIVFPILAGSHVVSEALAKALVRQDLAVLHLQRRRLRFETVEPGALMLDFQDSIRDARRFLDWLERKPEVDPQRIAAGGVSLGGMLASTLMGVDRRIRAGFFVMAGGGLAELLWDSTERPVRKFRDRLVRRHGLAGRDEFVAFIRPYTDSVDPLRFAPAIEPDRVLLISGRFDRVVPPERTQALWEALGGPRWIRLPVGHYQLAPFFFWSAARSAEHILEALAAAAPRPPVEGVTPVTQGASRDASERPTR